MQVDLGRVRHQPGERVAFEAEEVFEPLSLPAAELEFTAPVAVEGFIVNSGQVINVDFTAEVEGVLPCTRCLEPAVWRDTIPVNQTFRPTEVDPEEEDAPEVDPAVDLTDEEAETSIPFTGDKVDLTPVIRAAIAMEVPLKHLCRDDCQGLCSRCGQNLNEGQCDCEETRVDPRLAVLEEWKQDSGGGSSDGSP